MAETAAGGQTCDTLEAIIRQRLDATHVDVLDNSGGCGQIFEAVIVSPQFANLTTLARNRLVNTKLKEEIAQVHAWSQKCYTPEQWEKIRPKTDDEE